MDVLLIDDSEVIRNLYSDILSSRGDSVTSVNNGKAGLKLLAQNDYDLILLDMCMPRYSGMQFLEDLKNQKPSDLKRVIVISRLALDENWTDKLEEYGINSIEEKPLGIVSLESSKPLVTK